MSKQVYSVEETARLRSIMSPRMKAARLRLGMTQVEAAKEIGISAEFYARMERGNAMPSVETLCKIVSAFECTADYLFGADDSQDAAPVQPLPPRKRKKDAKNLIYITDRARDDSDLTRLLILLLKIREKHEGRVDEEDDDEDDLE